MKKSRYTDEQISYALRQAESGTSVADVCRQLGVREASFYVWKKKYGDGAQGAAPATRRERSAEPSGGGPDPGYKHILGEVVRKKL